MKNKFTLIALLLCIAISANAQSVKWFDGKDSFRKIGTNLYEGVPAGVVSFEIKKDTVWRLMAGQVDESGKPRGYIKRSTDRIMYYKENDIVGYYVPSQGRYYNTSGDGDTIMKEANAGVLSESTFLGNDGAIRYLVDPDFDLEALGVYLFLF